MRPKTLLLSVIIAVFSIFLFAYLKDSPENVQKVIDQIEKTTPKQVNSYLLDASTCSFTLDLGVKKLPLTTNYNSPCPESYVKDFLFLSKTKDFFIYLDVLNDTEALTTLSVVKVFSIENKDLIPYTLKTFSRSSEVIKLGILPNKIAFIIYRTQLPQKVASQKIQYSYSVSAYNLAKIYTFNPFNVDAGYNLQTQAGQSLDMELTGIDNYKQIKLDENKILFEDSKGVSLKEIDLTNGL